ncbi:hypothetical protein LH47_00613 [Anoxybacillus thermarum]|uniref:Uncharacterized protein n=1 Tax=Anoxybacillus thermarum TaxID=404937 RepID=A0A0D0R0Z3_9BACL|nr:hypothetical protein [Anoxybacillus thermarum]KIQ95359.1 hypothetical protein LH47_00613 [Anoxybacillus thermarum]
MFLSLLLSVMTVVSAQGDVCTKKLDEANVQLCGKEDGDWVRHFTLHVGKATYAFPEWEHVNDPKALPQLYSMDVTEDGKEDIVVCPRAHSARSRRREGDKDNIQSLFKIRCR